MSDDDILSKLDDVLEARPRGRADANGRSREDQACSIIAAVRSLEPAAAAQ